MFSAHFCQLSSSFLIHHCGSCTEEELSFLSKANSTHPRPPNLWPNLVPSLLGSCSLSPTCTCFQHFHPMILILSPSQTPQDATSVSYSPALGDSNTLFPVFSPQPIHFRDDLPSWNKQSRSFDPFPWPSFLLCVSFLSPIPPQFKNCHYSCLPFSQLLFSPYFDFCAHPCPEIGLMKIITIFTWTVD